MTALVTIMCCGKSSWCLGALDLRHCSLPLTAEVTFNSLSADISNLQSLHGACLLAFVQLAALNPLVVRLGVMSRPQLTNYEARGVTQVRVALVGLCRLQSLQLIYQSYKHCMQHEILAMGYGM